MWVGYLLVCKIGGKNVDLKQAQYLRKYYHNDYMMWQQSLSQPPPYNILLLNQFVLLTPLPLFGFCFLIKIKIIDTKTFEFR